MIYKTDKLRAKEYYEKLQDKEGFQFFVREVQAYIKEISITRVALTKQPLELMVLIAQRPILSFIEKNDSSYFGIILSKQFVSSNTDIPFTDHFDFKGGEERQYVRIRIDDYKSYQTRFKAELNRVIKDEFQVKSKQKLFNWNISSNTTNTSLQHLITSQINIDAWFEDITEVFSFQLIAQDLKDYIGTSGYNLAVKHKIQNTYSFISQVKGLISDKSLHFEIIKRKGVLFLEIHLENPKLSKNINPSTLSLTDDYEWFEWHNSGRSIRLKKTYLFVLDSNFRQLAEDLNAMEREFGNKINALLTGETSNTMSEENQKLINLIKHKKQIILQGPPGTGKTRLAKEIAGELNTPYWNLNRIKESLKVDQSIPKASGTLSYYRITNITDDYFELESERTSKSRKAMFSQVLLKLREIDQGILPKSKGGNDPYEFAVAKYLYFHGKVKYKVNHTGTTNSINQTTDLNDLIEGYKKYLNLNANHLADKTIIGYVETARVEIMYRWQNYFKEASTNFKFNEEGINNIDKLVAINYEGTRIFSGKTRFAGYLEFLKENKNWKSFIVNSKVEFGQKVEYKLIQFHPSYTYEDFVRGITVKNNDSGQIEYKTENKVLAEMAIKAKENWDNHHNGSLHQTQEEQLDGWFADFVDTIQLKLEEKDEMVMLTENIGISSIDETAFRYKSVNPNWSPNGLKMYFKDIKRAFLDGNKERQDIKNNKSLSGLAKQHASYYVKVLNLFQNYVNKNNLEFDDKNEKEPLKHYVLIIDEINRANLSSVLGELIYALEYRGEPVESMYELDGSREIVLPPNLYIIGTMNTADRSVGQIDYAIRRRFAFVDVLPKDLTGQLEDGYEFANEAFQSVSNLFDDSISEEFDKKDVQLGHSYFIHNNDETIDLKMDYEIKPILREYVTDGILTESALELIDKL